MTAKSSMATRRPSNEPESAQKLIHKRSLKFANRGFHMTKGMTIHLDAETIAALQQLKRQIDHGVPAGTPSFSLAALARHAVRKWCDHCAAPVPALGADNAGTEG